jgi:hypothetical protein
MGFNRRKMEDQRRAAAEKEAAACRATDAQVLEDAERLIGAWNERQAKRMPMLIRADDRGRHHHRGAAMTSLIPALSCRSCRPNAPFAEQVRLSQKSIADEMREDHKRRVFGE